MVTQDEETEAKDFLKRAEIRTMKKDLLKLREVDSLKERDKIATIKTLEEQLEEKKKADEAVAAVVKEKVQRDEVLQKGESEERVAEKDLKNSATEQERQQIFLFESQRLAFEKQVDVIDKEKDPALKLEKNKLLLTRRDQQAKLDSILEEDKKLEGEEKVITEKEQTTTIPAERKGLEKARWDLDKRIQDVEKKRWEAEKGIEDINTKIAEIDKSSEQLVIEKNELRNKILGADKSLREIYSVVMAREEEKRRGLAQEQVTRREALSKAEAHKNEQVQREQRFGRPPAKNDFINNIPVPMKAKRAISFEAENEQRKKFLQDVAQGTDTTLGQPQQKSNIQ